MCISTYYKYGYALLYKARAEIAPYQDWWKSRTSRDDIGSSKASGSNVREGDTEKGIYAIATTPVLHTIIDTTIYSVMYVVD